VAKRSRPTDPQIEASTSLENRGGLRKRSKRLERELAELGATGAIELGLAAALPAVFELTCSIRCYGRGERI
jgi:hypothetical protein